MKQFKIDEKIGPHGLLYAGNDEVKSYIAKTGLKYSIRFADFKCPECGKVERSRMYSVKKGTKTSNSCGHTRKSNIIKKEVPTQK